MDNLSEKRGGGGGHGVGFSLKTDIDSIFVIMEFDKTCEFTHYLPHNNLSNIIKLLKKYVKGRAVDFQKSAFKSIKTIRTKVPNQRRSAFVTQGDLNQLKQILAQPTMA